MLAFAAEHKMEACVAKPGLITKQGDCARGALATVLSWAGVVSNISVTAIAAGMIEQAVEGFEKEVLENADLARIGKAALSSPD